MPLHADPQLPESAAALTRIATELCIRAQKTVAYLKSSTSEVDADASDLSRLVELVRRAIVQIHKQAVKTAEMLQTSKRTDRDVRAGFDNVAMYSKRFVEIHLALQYLPMRAVKRETEYMLRDCFNGYFKKKKGTAPAPADETPNANDEPTVLLTPEFTAREFDLARILFTPGLPDEEESTENDADYRTPVLQLPCCDFESPSMWAMLAHELAHGVDREFGISRKIADSIPLTTPLKQCCEELVADHIATRVVGEAYPLAVISMHSCLFSKTKRIDWDPVVVDAKRLYPATRWRTRLLFEYLGSFKDQSLVEEQNFIDVAWRMRALYRTGDSAERQLRYQKDESSLNTYIRPINDAILKELESVDLDLGRVAIDAESSRRHYKRLENWLPIGAQGIDRKSLVASLAAYKRLGRKKKTRKRFYDLAEQFNEKPTPVSVTLSIAARRRLDLIRSSLGKNASIEELESLLRDLSRLDALIVASIGTAAVHSSQRVSERDDKDRDVNAAKAAVPTSLLSDIQILERIVALDSKKTIFISPVVDTISQIGPASIDVRLGTSLYITKVVSTTHIDLTKKSIDVDKQLDLYYSRQWMGERKEFVLHPGEFALAATLEYFRLPGDIAARLEGRSSLARLGVQIHATAGFVDPGFEGALTFELINSGRLPVRIPAGYRLGQLCFFPMTSVQVKYDEKRYTKYGGSPGVERSKTSEDPEVANRR